MNDENWSWSNYSNFWVIANNGNNLLNNSWSSDNSWSRDNNTSWWRIDNPWGTFGVTRKVLAPKTDFNVEIRQVDLGPEFIVYISASGKYSTPLTFGKWLTGTLDRESGHLVDIFPYDMDRNLVDMGTTIPIYRLVAQAFYGPTPEIIEIRHKDSDRTNNCVNNLAFD